MSKINLQYSIFVFFILTLLSCGKENTPNSTPTTPTTPEQPVTPTSPVPMVENVGYDFTEEEEAGWEVIWEENFDTDLADWTIWSGGAFNNELQHYQATNLFVENDYLYIRQQRRAVNGRTNPFDQTQKSFQFTSGRIESRTEYSPSREGGVLRYAARIKLPEGEGLWPAFWSYGDPWPTQGEIDVMEFRGGDPDTYSTNFFYGTVANQVLTNSAVQTFHVQQPTSLTEAFHVFELEWSEDQLIMKLDGNTVKTYDTSEFEYVDDLFSKMQRITLNLAVGGDFFSNLDETLIPNESYLVVDWVKVFKKS